MNTSKAFERAVALVFRQFAPLVPGVSIRTFQNLAEDYEVARAEGLREYPQIDLRCSPAMTDDNQHTQSVECVITMATDTEDDELHQQLASIYDGVEQILASLQTQFYGTPGEELDLLTETLAADLGAAFNFGGVSFSGGQPPYDDDGVNILQQVVTLHYSRS